MGLPPMRRGVTLLEVLIAITICALIIGALYLLLVQGAKVSTEMGKLTPAYRKASLAIDLIAKEMKEGFEHLYSPDPEDLFAEYGKSSMVVALSDPATEKKEVVGYVFDANQNRMVRILYDPSFDPEDPLTQKILSVPGNPKVLASDVSYCYFRVEEDLLLSIGVLLDGGKREISSKINFDFSR